ncbi:uncharacterized protein Tco025E_01225 [Trypanosoma conorhini]|uniref:Uncharacterized protein n=1 Tax=Trypanosoma conorhini TaxID=83891 RepID=A0A422Q933_9TRYP|nr:uncharacterized protein Tco025E_01225 [Trypanosoma conorhini]RNF26478.1 hypothetical protein Tco025E_01225 [Trypanosoma conorhini]
MPGPVGEDPLEDCYDTELFDALLGSEEAGSSATQHEASSSVFSKLFMVGGSLFSRRRAAAMARSHRARLRGTFLSWLNYGSIYCPFTKQFVSLRSPHWSHLVAAGFGIDTRLRHGRRVVLVCPEKLEGLACEVWQLQAPPPHGKGVTPERPLASWSPSLQASLGTLFQTPPVGDGKALVQRVRDFLREGNCAWRCRQIPLSFYDLEANRGRTFAHTSANERGSACSDRRAYTEDFMKFGESYLRQCLHWRHSVLQQQKKVTASQMEIIAGVESTAAPVAVSPPKEKASDLIDRHSAVNVASFLLPNSRLAYLSVTYTPNTSLLETAVRTVLEARLFDETFYCPLEHCIDYNSLMDVEAYRLRWDSFGVAKLEEGIPLLHLGMHMNPSRHALPAIPLVVIGNAHLLSKRAIARLLEQWTRNGLVWNTEQHRLRATGQGRRGILLRTGDPMRTIDAGAPLFGNIHALFLGYSSSSEEAPAGCSQHVVAEIQGRSARVRVLAPVAGSMFFLEEPLVAALRRVSPRFQESMNASERTLFIEELCDAMGRVAVPSFAGVTGNGAANHTNDKNCTACSDLRALEEENTLFQLQEACEAFLRASLERRDLGLLPYEQLLLRYPTFAAMRVRHELLHEYPLIIEAMETHSEPPHTRSSSFMKDRCKKHLFPLRRHSTVVESRRLALELAGAEHDALKRACVVATAVHRVSQALTTRGSVSSLMYTTTAPPPPSQAHSYDMKHQQQQQLMRLEQRYDPCFEPPVLVGFWTRTLLFCAPMAADLLPLRCLIYRDLTAAAERPKAFVVVDVDVFHVDYVSYPSDRRCRLFGIRLRYSPCVGDDAGSDAREAATRALQDALAKSAVEARLFPIWTHDVSSKKRQDTREIDPSPGAASEAGRGHSFVPHFHFEELDECVSAATPNLLERRLFALAMAQRGPLVLTIGTQVVVLRTISSHVTRGTWCRVVRFVPLHELLLHRSASFPAQFGAASQGAAELSLARRYFAQQRGSNSVPVLQPLMENGASVTGAMEAVVLPAAMLVGGYRALHHYALPAAQLPLLAPCQYAAASTLFHPLFAHEDSLMEFVSTETRAKAAAMMLSCPSSSSPRVSEGFLCSNFFEDVESSTQTTGDGPRQHETQRGDVHASCAMHSDVVSALSLFPPS